MYKTGIRHLGALSACLFLSSCLLTTQVGDLLDQIEHRQLETSLPGADADADPGPGGAKPGTTNKQIEDDMLAFIQKHPDKPDMIAPLWVRLGVFYMNSGRGVLAEEAFESAKTSGGALSTTLSTTVTLGDDLIWLYTKNSKSWKIDGINRAIAMVEKISNEIDKFSKDSEIGDKLDTLLWLHNLRMRVEMKVMRQFTGGKTRAQEWAKRGQDVLTGYLKFWNGREAIKDDAIALARAINFGANCSPPKPPKAVTPEKIKLKDRLRIRWSVRVLCNVEQLQREYDMGARKRISGNLLGTAAAPWITCSMKADGSALDKCSVNP